MHASPPGFSLRVSRIEKNTDIPNAKSKITLLLEKIPTFFIEAPYRIRVHIEAKNYIFKTNCANLVYGKDKTYYLSPDEYSCNTV